MSEVQWYALGGLLSAANAWGFYLLGFRRGFRRARLTIVRHGRVAAR